jgi:hypothetical protein
MQARGRDRPQKYNNSENAETPGMTGMFLCGISCGRGGGSAGNWRRAGRRRCRLPKMNAGNTGMCAMGQKRATRMDRRQGWRWCEPWWCALAGTRPATTKFLRAEQRRSRPCMGEGGERWAA